MCLAYKLPGKEVQLWHMAHPEHMIEESSPPQDLFDWIKEGGLVEAHNAFFERVIWLNVMVKRHGWPRMPAKQWRCSAAKASMCSLPRSLEGAGQAMALDVEKDMEGRRLMLKMCKPRKPRKAERQAWASKHGRKPMSLLWHEEENDIYRLWDYCKKDVLTEEALSEILPDLPENELTLWQIDQDMNERGARFDLDMATAALKMAADAKEIMNEELEEITGVERATQRQQVKDWLLENEDLEIPDTKAETIDWYLTREQISGRARRILEIVKQVNRTSTRKYQAMLDKTDHDDWRARDLLMYHGANTGRWSGKGIQVQNFPRGNIKDMDEACEDIHAGHLGWVEAMHGDPMEFLSGALRGAIIPAEDHDLIVADYSAIEARCVLWEAGAEAALDVFRRGGDIYCDMATGIYGYEVNKKDHPKERQFGKQAILGLGYGMGFLTFLLTCRKYNIHFGVDQVKKILRDKYDKYYEWVEDYLFPKPTGDAKKDQNKRRQASKTRRKLTDAREDPKKIIHELALMKYTVDVYRTRYPEVKQLWKDQEDAAMAAVREWEALVHEARQAERFDYEMEHGAITAENISFGAYPWEESRFKDLVDGPVKKAGKIKWYVKGGFLCCELPSGRILRYRDPHLKPTKTAWGETKMGLRYMTVIVGGKWARTGTYGGKLVENITQAVARDFMSDATIRCVVDNTPYRVIMSVHDELVAEVRKDEGSLEDFENVMSKSEPWGYGCPITAEAERYARYRK